MKTIKKTMTINAPKEKVWDVLLKDKYTKTWYSEFSEGSYAQTDWKEGSKALFLDHSGMGIIAKITANKPCELISMVYEGVIVKGKEDYESELANKYKGGKETYRLSGQNGTTQLAIESDMEDAYFEIMSASWDKALKKLKDLAEGN